LTSALARLLAVSEAYPELKANPNFIALQEELTSTENRIAHARQFYNDCVAKLNTQIQLFPTVVVAGMFGFKEEPFFESACPRKRTSHGGILIPVTLSEKCWDMSILPSRRSRPAVTPKSSMLRTIDKCKVMCNYPTHKFTSSITSFPGRGVSGKCWG